MIDTEGYELRRLPWWYSPLTGKQVHFDVYSMLSFWRWMVEADIIRLLRERGFVGEEYLLLEGEFDRGELQEREGMFKVDPTKRVVIRRYPLDIERIPEVYTPRLLETELLTAYTIVEKLKFLKIYLTFSIETGAGHELFYAEVTCDTVVKPDLIASERQEIVRRVVNAVLKLFFIVFDGLKVVKTAEKEKDPDWLIRLLIYLQKYADPIYERGPREGMDGFLDMMMERIRARPPDEYVTRESQIDVMVKPKKFATEEAIITIGIEYEAADLGYEYPYVHVDIEKVRVRHYHIERTLVVAPATSIWMDEILGMVITW